MDKPRYMEEMLKIIFFWLGVAFVVTGLLCFIGVLTPREGSAAQVSSVLGIVFALLGAAFFVAQMILKKLASSKNKLHNELLISGTRVNGTVEKVYLQKYTQYGSESPYRILYRYTWQGRTYVHKSRLLWEKPDLRENDPIVVYADSSGKSAIQLSSSTK